MLKKLITWGVIFILSILISTQTAIEQGMAFLWSYIGVNVLIVLVVTIVFKCIGELDDGSAFIAFFKVVLLLAIGLVLYSIIAWLICAIFSMVDFYVAFQIICLVMCFAPDNSKK